MGINTCLHGCWGWQRCLSSVVLHFIFWDRISHETRKGQQGISKCSLQTKLRVTHRRTAGVSGTYNIEKPTPAWVTNWESSVFGVPGATSSRQLDHRAVPSSEIVHCLYYRRKGPHKCCKTCCLLCVVSLECLSYSSKASNALMHKKQLSNNRHTSSGHFILSISFSLMFPEPWGLTYRCMIVFFHLLMRTGTPCHNNNNNVLFSQFNQLVFIVTATHCKESILTWPWMTAVAIHN